jgi:hypothetical protein
MTRVITEPKTPLAMARRIEQLGQLNDRRVKYTAAGDRESLLKLADEYAKRRMTTMAAEIRREAEGMD